MRATTAREAEWRDEIESHVALRADWHRADGLPAEEAERTARAFSPSCCLCSPRRALQVQKHAGVCTAAGVAAGSPPRLSGTGHRLLWPVRNSPKHAAGQATQTDRLSRLLPAAVTRHFSLSPSSELAYHGAMRKLGSQTLVRAIMATLVSLATALYAQTKVESAASANPSKGEDVYRQFCAVCHGPDGKGNGPAASALKVRATDLTQLSRQNNGKFPALHVKNILNGVASVAAHGNFEMPTWGDTFKSTANTTAGPMRIDALVEYLQKIQR